MLEADSNYRSVELQYSNPETHVEVYFAYDVSRRREVVIKRVACWSEDEAERCMREGQRTISERHPNICECYDVHVVPSPRPSQFWTEIVTEKLDHDLSEEIQVRRDRHDPFPESSIRKFLQELIAVLAYLQRKQVAHRDIKPHNIYIDLNGTAKLGDFGAAKETIDDIGIGQSTVLGTPLYLSPKVRMAYIDVISGAQTRVTHNVFKSDVYSLGLTLIHCMTLEPPTNLAVLVGLQEKIGETLRGIRGYSEEVLKVVAEMVRVEEDERPDFLQLDQLVNGFQAKEEKSYVVRCGICYLCETQCDVFVLCPCHPACLQCLHAAVVDQLSIGAQEVTFPCGEQVPKEVVTIALESI